MYTFSVCAMWFLHSIIIIYDLQKDACSFVKQNVLNWVLANSSLLTHHINHLSMHRVSSFVKAVRQKAPFCVRFMYCLTPLALLGHITTWGCLAYRYLSILLMDHCQKTWPCITITHKATNRLGLPNYSSCTTFCVPGTWSMLFQWLWPSGLTWCI